MTPCVLWTGSTSNSGYGTVWGERKPRLAHRVAWELANGIPVPEGLWVLHDERCISKLCVRPSHLSVGTPSQNLRSAWEAGKSNHPKLDKKTIGQMRLLIDKGFPSRLVCKAFGVCKSYLRHRKYRDKINGMEAPGRAVRPGANP